jgi:phosphohistidine swiveling domain-containing protein
MSWTNLSLVNDRIKGYQAAAKETEEQDLKVCLQLITTSQKCNQELIKEVKKLGGEIIEERFTSVIFYACGLM